MGRKASASLDSLGLATQHARRMQEDGRSCDQVDMPAKLVGWLRPVDWRGMISPLEGGWICGSPWAVGMEESYCPVREWNGEEKRKGEPSSNFQVPMERGWR